MSHAYHEELEGYDPRQIWFSGCPECEQRGKGLPHSINSLDTNNFARAMIRSIEWNHDLEVGHISNAERDLLETLWVMYNNIDRVPSS